MKFKSREQARKQYWNLGSFWSFILGALMLGGGSVNWAQETNFGLGEWRVTPRISVGATYSDNIQLMPDGQTEDDLVFQVDPGISVRKHGGRLDLRLDYTAQGLLYTNNGDANKINNQLQAFGTAEIFQKNFFLDAYGSISQVPINSSSRTDTGNLGATGGHTFQLVVFQ
ncbi:MAG: TIGR03016 family PEP-CTERM system-associated outer membrane protein [Candidatus Competibacter sp.]